MENKKIIVSKKEVDLYKKLIENSYTVDPVEKKSHRKLYNELQTAFLLEISEMPPNIVRLNSIVTIQTSFGRKDGIQLVLPEEGDLGKRKLSIMSPMGSALIGYQEGDEVIWNLPNGEDKIKIEKVINGINVV